MIGRSQVRRLAWRSLLGAAVLLAATSTTSIAESLVVPMRYGDVGT